MHSQNKDDISFIPTIFHNNSAISKFIFYHIDIYINDICRNGTYQNDI